LTADGRSQRSNGLLRGHGTLSRGGFSVVGAYRANLALDSYIYGFTMREVAWPVEAADVPGRAEAFVDRTPVDEYPHLVETASLVADADFDRGGDFEFGLDLVLDGLQRPLGLATD
jgi:hypothetical protein